MEAQALVIVFGFSLPEITIICGAIGSILGICRKYNFTPRRFLGWLVAVKMKETDQATARYYKKEYDECASRLAQCQDNSP